MKKKAFLIGRRMILLRCIAGIPGALILILSIELNLNMHNNFVDLTREAERSTQD